MERRARPAQAVTSPTETAQAPDLFPAEVARLADLPEETVRRGEAAREYAQEHFTREGFAQRFEQSLRETIAEVATSPADYAPPG